MGIDIEPGCAAGRCYSVVVLEDGRLLAKYESVPLHRLIRLAWEYKPDVIAVDNVMELAESGRELAKLASMLPLETSIVQVTRLPDGSFVDIKKLARAAGIDVGHGKLTPSRTAYVAALLAGMGYGSHVRFVEEKTKIIISKSRRLKHGGMSNPRFQRRVRAAILRAMKDVKKLLDKHRLDYDLMIRKSGGGLDSAIFIVYASREALKGIVKPYEDNDVRIEIKPIYTGKLYFEPTETGTETLKPYIIVGVDPGISTAVAIIDIHGRFVSAVSKRGFDRSEVIEYIMRHGIPVLVATDVRPAPDFVKKLAATLGVPLYEPPASLSVDEKRAIFDAYLHRYPKLRRIADAHIRDALAAALKAYQSYESKFRQIESYTARIGLEIDVDQVKAEVLKGATIAEAIEKAINHLLNDITPSTYLVKSVRRDSGKDSSGSRESEEKSSLDHVRRELEELRAENRMLRRRLEELNEVVKRLENEYRLFKLEHDKSVERDRTISMLANEVSVLRSELDKARGYIESLEKLVNTLTEAVLLVAKGEAIPVIIVDEMDGESFELLSSYAKGYGRIPVKVKTVNPVHWRMRGREVSKLTLAILLPEKQLAMRDVIEQYGIPVLPAEKYLILEAGKIGVADPKLVVDAYERLEELKRRQSETAKHRNIDVRALRRILEEYRSTRAKVLFESENSDFTLDE